MAYSTIVFGNETEAVAFAEKNEYGTKDIKAIAEKIAEIPLEGCLLYTSPSPRD